MKKNNVEELLFSAFADAVPDQRDEIVKKASAKKTPGALMSIDQVNYRQKYLHYAAMAAAVLVLIVGIILSVSFARSREVVGTVTVEGAECYEIELNRSLRPLTINGRDSAAKQTAHLIRRDYDTLGEAVDRILDTMLETGSLNDHCNTVLITVSLEEKPQVQLSIAVEAAKKCFNEAGFDGAILGTVASDNKEILNISRRYAVSVGKAGMVHDILAADRSFRTYALCRLSVNDLHLLSLYRQIPYDAVSAVGTPHGCITPEEAAHLALGYVSEPDAAAEAVLTCDDSGLTYIVTVTTGEGAVDCRLSAITGELIADDTPPATEPTEDPAVPTAPPTVPAAQPTEPTQPQNTSPAPTTAPTTAPTQRPTEAPVVPTQPVPTQPAPTEPPTQPTPTEPDIFTRSMYYAYTAGVITNDILPDTARPIAFKRIWNGYDTYYDADTFPYTAPGVQGGVTALVFNAAQFRALTGTDDESFDDAYFEHHVLYIYMNRDASYHWTKSLTGAYIDGSVLYLEDAEAIGRYVGDQDTRIHTVIYELNKDDLRAFTALLEFE